jgi:endonuclease/exonuclease/phosphatase family metal-dependent hydrolase
MAFTRIALGEGAGLCVVNLHATNDRADLATADVLRAADAAIEWAGDSPLLFGGDLNLRPAEDPVAFEALRERFELDGATHPRAIDHLLTRNLEIVEAPSVWPPGQRELSRNDLRLRLSDHAPVQAHFKTGSP